MDREKMYEEIENKILNGETDQTRYYCLYEYRDKAGTGSLVPFYSKEEAIAYAEREWERLAESDKKSYMNDICGEFNVSELEYNIELECFDTSAYSPVWDAIENERYKALVDKRTYQLYDHLGVDINDVDKDHDLGYLTENVTEDGEIYLWYMDDSREATICIESGRILDAKWEFEREEMEALKARFIISPFICIPLNPEKESERRSEPSSFKSIHNKNLEDR